MRTSFRELYHTIHIPHLVLAAVLVGAAVTSMSFVVDTILLAPRAILFSDILAGLMAAVLSFYAMKNHVARKHLVLSRNTVVAHVNHHVRNALSVLAYSADLCSDERFRCYAKDAVHRIDWTLREVLGSVPTGGHHVSTPPTYERNAVAKIPSSSK